MTDVGKILFCAGLIIAGLGALIWLAGKAHIPLGQLPGDIRIERENFKFYFPVVTGLILSVVLTVLIWLFRHK